LPARRSAAIGWFDFFLSVGELFLYYDGDVHEDLSEKAYLLHRENRTVYAILKPRPTRNTTLLDLYYDPDATSNFTAQLVATISTSSILASMVSFWGMNGREDAPRKRSHPWRSLATTPPTWPRRAS